MILSYCLNPSCRQPKNKPDNKVCQTCRSSLILRKRYRAIKKIGKGGFRATFLAIDLSLPDDPFCVIKQLRTSADNPDAFKMALELFEREAKTLGKIDHPQIPRLLDYFEDAHQFYLVQSLIKGKNLQQEVKQNGTFTENQAKCFLAGILPVLQYIHSIKIIHRDIKPANIIRREQDNRLILIDFGSVGTIGFAPPEQLSMRPVYASDIFALAATCLYLLTGKCPQDLCDNVTGELRWQQETKVSSSFANVLDKMLELEVRKRYQSAEEVIKYLS